MPAIGDGEFAMGYRAGLRTAEQTFGPEEIRTRIHEVLTHRQLGVEASARLERVITTSVAGYQEVQDGIGRELVPLAEVLQQDATAGARGQAGEQAARHNVVSPPVSRAVERTRD